jgi:hypothetical protein
MKWDVEPNAFSYYLNHRPARRKPWEASSTPDIRAAQYNASRFQGSVSYASSRAATATFFNDGNPIGGVVGFDSHCRR